MTTVKPSRQDLANKVSLTGKVALNPTYGLAMPVDGEIRYLTVTLPTGTPTKPIKVANIWVNGKSAGKIEVPAGSVFSGRLVDDRSKVTAGTPVVSAKYVGYGLVADIDGGQAYKLTDSLGAVTAQITNGPGPFACTVLGTVAALPAGTIPEPPVIQPSAPPSGQPAVPQQPSRNNGTPSEPTGMRVVCLAPADVRLINGAAATLQFVTATASNVMVLPVEAVAGSQGKGKVDVLKADGSRETRDVVLGLTDGKVIEIKAGLTGEETVAVPAPDLPPAKGTGGDQGGPTGVITK